MATDAAQLDLGLHPVAAPEPPKVARARTFAGLSLVQALLGALLLLAAIWAMWTTREVLALRQHKVVSVRLGELVNQFALAEARSGDDPDKVTARTRAFMMALDHALKERSAAGAVVLVGEAVVSSPGEDITASIAADVAKHVPMPIAQALPPRLPAAPPTPSSSPFAVRAQQGSTPGDYAPSAYQQGEAGPSAGQGGPDVQP